MLRTSQERVGGGDVWLRSYFSECLLEEQRKTISNGLRLRFEKRLQQAKQMRTASVGEKVKSISFHFVLYLVGEWLTGALYILLSEYYF